jgi:hypothetical protein
MRLKLSAGYLSVLVIMTSSSSTMWQWGYGHGATHVRKQPDPFLLERIGSFTQQTVGLRMRF